MLSCAQVFKQLSKRRKNTPQLKRLPMRVKTPTHVKESFLQAT